MECARLSDAELLRLVRGGGQGALPARRKLEQRHLRSVRAFASACVLDPPAADELARQAWEQALRREDGSPTGALRPHALSTVLRTAAGWAVTGRQSVLHPDLAAWAEADAHAAEKRGGSVVARAFESLPDRSRTVLWHDAVEHDESAWIDRLLGARAEGARAEGVAVEEAALLNRRARGEFYHSYVQIHQDGMVDDACRRFHRMVLAYADHKSIDAAADLVPHLEGCAYCSRAVADLERMHVDRGALLAEALLPWGGVEYAARGAAGEGREATTEATAEELPPLLDVTARPRPRNGTRRRADRLVRSAALIGLCSLALALAYSAQLGPGSPQSDDSAPERSGPPAPATPGPSRTTATATATATSTVTATRTPPPPPSATGRPPVRGAAVEWLFDEVNGTVTEDSSGNGSDGTLLGDPLPKASQGGVVLDGRQSVATHDVVVDTNESFSVSARVKLRDSDGFQTVLSQDGSRISGFSLQYDAEAGRWAMAVRDEDSTDSDKDEAVSESSAETGRWTHLTGVYDDPEDELRLFVDGSLEDTSEHSRDWRAEGDFAAGRALWGENLIQGFTGSIDEVRAYSRALSSAEAEALAG
ncbi:MAG: LamG-like jellyroll fold domain-containing protein [Streptomyces sp.]